MLEQDAPAHLAPRAVQRKDRLPLVRLGPYDGDDDRVAFLQILDVGGRERPHLAGGDDPFGLLSDVDEDAVLINFHDDSIDDLAAIEILVPLLGLVEQLVHIEFFGLLSHKFTLPGRVGLQAIIGIHFWRCKGRIL